MKSQAQLLITSCFPSSLGPVKRPSDFQISKARIYSVCSQNKSNVILNENSEAEREKAREWGKKRLKSLINGAIYFLLMFLQVHNSSILPLFSKPAWTRFIEGVCIIDEGTENLALYMGGICLVLFLRITCSSTACAAFIPAQGAESHCFLCLLSGLLLCYLLVQLGHGSTAAGNVSSLVFFHHH